LAWDLRNIRGLVRDLIGAPSSNDVSDHQLNVLIENFVQIELVASLRLEEIEDYYRLRTFENLDRYGNLPSNFAITGVAWANGRSIDVYRDPGCFYEKFPQNYKSRENIATGDGGSTNFTGTLNQTPVNQDNIIIDDDLEVFSPRKLEVTAVTKAANAAITTKKAHLLSTGDVVQIGKIQSGMLELNGFISKITVTGGTSFTLDGVSSSNFRAYESGGVVIPINRIPLEGSNGGTGSVVVSTGAFDVTFNSAPSDDQDIRASYEVISVGDPDAILLQDRELIVRPVPDGVWDLKIAITKQPTNLRDSNDNFDDSATLPRDDWGPYVGYGTAIDHLNREGLQESAFRLEPRYKDLEAKVNSRWIRNNEHERSTPVA